MPDAWKELIKDVQKLAKEPREEFVKDPELKTTPKITQANIYQGNKLDNLAVGCFDNVDANTAKRFKKGEISTEAELDLHGYTVERAYEAVIRFVKNAYLRKKRCIAIITGKGLHQTFSDDIFSSRGALKDWVPKWLNNAEIRPLILSIIHPENRDGGEGVIKLLLRRQR